MNFHSARPHRVRKHDGKGIALHPSAPCRFRTAISGVRSGTRVRHVNCAALFVPCAAAPKGMLPGPGEPRCRPSLSNHSRSASPRSWHGPCIGDCRWNRHPPIAPRRALLAHATAPFPIVWRGLCLPPGVPEFPLAAGRDSKAPPRERLRGGQPRRVPLFFRTGLRRGSRFVSRRPLERGQSIFQTLLERGEDTAS